MSLSSTVPHGSAATPNSSSNEQNSETTNIPALVSADEATVRIVNDILSSANIHPRHPDPRSGLLESHILPVIYTKYHFEDCKLGFLQYTKEMVEKHQEVAITLKKGDIAIYWAIQVRREYPDGHPLRQILMDQVLHILCQDRRANHIASNSWAIDGEFRDPALLAAPNEAQQ